MAPTKPKVSAGNILIVSSDNRFSVLATLGPEANKITDGVGGWSLVQRPHKIAFTQYDGKNPFAGTLSLMLDGHDTNTSVEHAIRSLYWMSLPTNDGEKPRRVHIYGSALPYPLGVGEWIINGIQEGSMVIWDRSGDFRVRQDLTVTVIKYVAPDALSVIRPGQGLAPNLTGKYRVKSGDTVRSVASYYYGDPAKGKYILEANGWRDATQIKKHIGKDIIVPSITGHNVS